MSFKPQRVVRRSAWQRVKRQVRNDLNIRENRAFHVRLKPYRSHQRDVSPFPFSFNSISSNPLEWFGSKRFVLALAILAVVIGSVFFYQSPAFHSSEPGPMKYSDPIVPIWTATSPKADLSEFKTQSVSYEAPCANGAPACMLQNPGTCCSTSSIALTNTVIGDLSPVSGKTLDFKMEWGINAPAVTFDTSTGNTAACISCSSYQTPAFTNAIPDILLVHIGIKGATGYQVSTVTDLFSNTFVFRLNSTHVSGGTTWQSLEYWAIPGGVQTNNKVTVTTTASVSTLAATVVSVKNPNLTNRAALSFFDSHAFSVNDGTTSNPTVGVHTSEYNDFVLVGVSDSGIGCTAGAGFTIISGNDPCSQYEIFTTPQGFTGSITETLPANWSIFSDAVVGNNPVGLQTDAWGFYLTTNSKLPTGNYNPLNDPTVFLAVVMNPVSSGSANVVGTVYMLRNLGKNETLNQEEPGGCSPSGSCYITNTNNPSSNTVDEATLFLNFTSGGNSGGSCATTNFSYTNPGSGNGCSYFAMGQLLVNFNLASSTTLPWFPFQAHQYYLGFWEIAGATVNIEWTFNQGSGSLLTAYFQCGSACTVSPTIDTGGFFGPIVKALISIGVFILANLFEFGAYLAGLFWPIFVSVANGLWNLVQSLASALQVVIVSVLNVFEAIVKSLLNTIGATVGFPTSAGCNFVSNPSGCGLGDDLFQEVTYLISAVTTNLATFIGGLSNIFIAIADFFASVTTWFATWGTYFVNAILAIANLVSEMIVVVKNLLLLGPSTFTWGALIMFIVYSGLDGLDGWFSFFETFAWLLLFGVSIAERILNWLISMIVWIVSQIPAFNLQADAATFGGGAGGKYMVGFDLPRLPLVEHNFRPHFPKNFTDPELGRLNLFAILGLVVGTFMLIYSVGANLIPGVNASNGVNLNLINGLLPIGLTLITAFGAVIVPFLLAQLFRGVFHINIQSPGIGVGLARGKARVGSVSPRSFKIGRKRDVERELRKRELADRLYRERMDRILIGQRDIALRGIERLQRETRQLREQKEQRRVIDVPKNGYRVVKE